MTHSPRLHACTWLCDVAVARDIACHYVCPRMRFGVVSWLKLFTFRMMSSGMRDMSNNASSSDAAHHSSSGSAPSARRKLCCKNVGFETTEMSLLVHFSRFGSITEVWMMMLMMMINFL